jgi:hypothetical protein
MTDKEKNDNGECEVIYDMIGNIKDDVFSSDDKAELIVFLMENKQKYDMILHLSKSNKHDLITSLLKRYLKQSRELSLDSLDNLMKFLKQISDSTRKRIMLNKSTIEELKDYDGDLLDLKIDVYMVDEIGSELCDILKKFQSNPNLLRTFNKLPQNDVVILRSYVVSVLSGDE